MIKKIKFTVLLFCFSLPLAKAQQDTTLNIPTRQELAGTKNAISTFNMFREPSYILFGSGLGTLEPLIFEGDLIPYFIISVSKRVKWGLELSPRIIIRMYNQDSYPVRTPSFKPRATFFYQFLDEETGKRDLFTYISIMHHSNGQEGSFYNTDSTTINTLSGSFSTNWVEAGMFLSRPNNRLQFNTNYIKLYAMYNYSQEPELSGIYGHLRFFIQFKSTVKLSDAFRIIVAPQDKNKKYAFNQSLRLGWIAGELNDAKNIDIHRLMFNYTLSVKPTFLNDVNIFVQYYYGQDYYNIHFNRQISVFRVGISTKARILS
jgi:hypothetical protein